MSGVKEHPTIKIADLVKLRTQAKRLSWDARKRATLTANGRHTAIFRGRGLDFSELREYVPGDEIRYLDWRVTARTGKPHTKLFCEDRERSVYLIVDLNPSMYFGTKITFKSVIAARAAALLGWAGVLHHDSVGGVVISSNAFIEVVPEKREQSIFALLKAMVSATEEGSARPWALSSLKQKVQRGALVVVISDFYTFNDALSQACKALAMQCEVVFVWVYDALEKKSPPPQRYAITDQHAFTEWDTQSEAYRHAYHAVFQQRQHTIETFTKRHGISLLTLSTQDQVERELPRQWEARRI